MFRPEPAHYLFDWGDTLMVDFPNQSGKMKDWPHVKICDNAQQVLAFLSQKAKIHIATSARDSQPEDIQQAFALGGLAKYIDNYFCRYNTGFGKDKREFYTTIIGNLGVLPAKIVMTGDNLHRDVLPCLELGMQAVLLDTTKKLQQGFSSDGFYIIHNLSALLEEGKDIHAHRN